MAESDESKFQPFLWEKGSLRILHATWTAVNMSYGLTAEEVTVWAEYFSLLSDCFANIAVAMGEPIYLYNTEETSV